MGRKVGSQQVEQKAIAAMSLRIDRSLYERLRKLAFDRQKPMLEFIVRGIEMVLKAERY